MREHVDSVAEEQLGAWQRETVIGRCGTLKPAIVYWSVSSCMTSSQGWPVLSVEHHLVCDRSEH